MLSSLGPPAGCIYVTAVACGNVTCSFSACFFFFNARPSCPCCLSVLILVELVLSTPLAPSIYCYACYATLMLCCRLASEDDATGPLPTDGLLPLLPRPRLTFWLSFFWAATTVAIYLAPFGAPRTTDELLLLFLDA